MQTQSSKLAVSTMFISRTLRMTSALQVAWFSNYYYTNTGTNSSTDLQIDRKPRTNLFTELFDFCLLSCRYYTNVIISFGLWRCDHYKKHHKACSFRNYSF